MRAKYLKTKMQMTDLKPFALYWCGELGIRTPGPVTVNSFQDCRNRPLCQLSGRKSTFFFVTQKFFLISVNYFQNKLL